MYNLMMTNPTIPSYMPRKKTMQSRMDAAAQMGSAPSEFDNALRAATEIATLISTIPVDGKNKVEAYSKLMNEVKNDDTLTGSEKAIIIQKIADIAFNDENVLVSQPGTAVEKDIPDTYYDPDGVLDNPEKSYTAKPMMVTPDAVLRYSAMATLNLYQYMGMPCLICVAYDFGICTYTSDITYEFIMELASRDHIDKIYFTDGKGVAIVK